MSQSKLFFNIPQIGMSLLLIGSVLIGEVAFADRDFPKYVDPQARLNLMTVMRVRRDFKAPKAGETLKENDKDNYKNKIDMVQLLSERCGFQYGRDQAGNPVRPQVQCQYHPRPADNPFNGMSPKFECTFAELDSKGKPKLNEQGQPKTKNLKVKYNERGLDGGGYKEIAQAVLGTGIGRMMGFYGHTACPADVVCKNCPSDDPWNDSDRSSDEGRQGKEYRFRNAIVEMKQKGDQFVDINHVNSEKPQGFSFNDEMRNIFPANQPQLTAQLKAEREAVALWANFIRHTDSDPHNNDLVCVTSKNIGTTDKPSYICELVVGYISDYGDSFGFRGKKERISLSEFMKDSLQGSGNSVVAVGGASSASNYPISKAGRDLFVSMAKQVTDQQLKDIFTLAQMEKVSDASVDQWIQGFKAKVAKIQSVPMQ